MSGPALKHVDSHSAIHEAALNEAAELTTLLDQLVKNNHTEKALEVAFITLEHWETRTLRHADAEEAGLYKELVEADPSLKDAITELTRDHDLLRFIAKEIKELLDEGAVNDSIVQRFQSLIIVDELHNRAEEEILPDH